MADTNVARASTRADRAIDAQSTETRGPRSSALKGNEMRQNLMLLAAICLALVNATNGSVKKGDVAFEVSGGWVMEKTDTGNIEGTAPGIDFGDVLSGATGADLDSWMVMIGLSRFATDHLQLGVAGFYTQMNGDTESFALPDFPDVVAEFDLDLTAFGIGGRARYHFNPTDKWVGYVGAQAFWVSADVDVDGTIPGFEGIAPPGSNSDSPSGILWGPVAGLRCPLGQRDELLLEYQYHLWAGDVGDVIENGHGFFLGLSHRTR